MIYTVRDYLPQLEDELSRAGVAERVIDRFRTFWGALPPHREQAPCPFCFSKGIDAPLVELNAEAGIDQVRCAACKRIFVLRRALHHFEPA